MSHTLGPWHINRQDYESSYIAHEYIESEYGQPICGIWNPGVPDQTANARLICAAPDLLEALIRLRDLDVNCSQEEDVAAWAQAHSAIAKARP